MQFKQFFKSLIPRFFFKFTQVKRSHGKGMQIKLKQDEIDIEYAGTEPGKNDAILFVTFRHVIKF